MVFVSHLIYFLEVLQNTLHVHTCDDFIFHMISWFACLFADGSHMEKVSVFGEIADLFLCLQPVTPIYWKLSWVTLCLCNMKRKTRIHHVHLTSPIAQWKKFASEKKFGQNILLSTQNGRTHPEMQKRGKTGKTNFEVKIILGEKTNFEKKKQTNFFPKRKVS